MRRAVTYRLERHVSVVIRALLVFALVALPAALPVMFTPGAVPLSAVAADGVNSPMTMTKTHTTSITQPGNDTRAATIGEHVEFTVTVTVPKGTTLPKNATLVDQLPVGFVLLGPEYPERKPRVTWNGVEANDMNATSVPGQRAVRVNFSKEHAAVAADAKLKLTYSAYVANVSAAVHGAGLVNTATLDYTAEDGQRVTATATDTTPVVEPDIGVTLTGQAGDNNVVDPGESIPLTVTVSNALGAATANDSVVSVVVPGSLTLDATSIPMLKGVAGTYVATTRALSWPILSCCPPSTGSWLPRPRRHFRGRCPAAEPTPGPATAMPRSVRARSGSAAPATPRPSTSRWGRRP